MIKKNIGVICSLLFAAIVVGGCSGEGDQKKKLSDQERLAAGTLSAIAYTASGDMRLLSLDIKSKKIASEEIEDGASLFIDVPESRGIGVVNGTEFSLVDKKTLRIVSFFRASKKIEYATVCGGKIFLIDQGSQISSLKISESRIQMNVRVSQIDISKGKITDAACFGSGKYLAIAMSGTAKKMLVLSVKSGKIFDRFDLKLSQGKLGQGPLIAGDRLGNFTYMVFNEYGNNRRNFIFRYDMIDQKEDKMLSLGTDSKILFRPYYLSEKDLMLVAADIATSDTRVSTASVDSTLEKKNHVVLIDPKGLELRRIIELPGGYFSTKAVAIKNEQVYFAVQGQIFRLDIKSGKLINFADLPTEVVAYLFP